MKFIHKNGFFELGKKTFIMGILNVTPDSFYDGGKYNSPDKAFEQALKMVNDGTDIIDIGANSTRPGANVLTSEEEISIIKEYIPFLTDNIGIPFSVDTFYPEVAEYALQNGASIINDVSGVFNEKMARVVKKYNAGWVIMFNGSLQGAKSEKARSVINSANDFFCETLEKCEQFGIDKEQIMIDPGVGFTHSYNDDIELIKNISQLQNHGCAILMALSNKRVIRSASGADGDDRVYGTVAANVISVTGGADFVRVHNVRENKLAMNLTDVLLRV